MSSAVVTYTAWTSTLTSRKDHNMGSENRSYNHRSASQEVLAKLGRLYKNTIQYDVFGRRAALPSEVARVLARRTAEPVYTPATTGDSDIASAG